MHMMLTQKILDGCRARADAGKDVTRANAEFGPEMYEDCIIGLGAERDRARQDALTNLAGALRKVCPEVIPAIIAAHAEHNRKVAMRDEAFENLLVALGKPEQPQR